jgi:aspartyl-tRNA(Asn)/glutamyl-tRNA(Gln) amidotransferase subunit A
MQAADPRSLGEVSNLVRSGELSPTSLVERCLERIEAGRELNAFITVMADSAMDAARTAAREIADGRYRGRLHGIPVSVKDLIDVAGTKTTSGSGVPPLEPSRDAEVVRRLREAGAIIIGKTNLHEFAFGTTGEDTAFGPIRNPYDSARSAGGSSSGAAVALVEGMCFASIGTDTGGSIRIPAAACGTVGLKGTYGEVPADGVVPLSRTCDHVGPLTRTVGDAFILMEVLAGKRIHQALGGSRGTFGLPQGYLLAKLDPQVRESFERTVKALESAGHRVRPVEIPLVDITADVYLHVVLPEASEYHAPMLAAHADKYSPNVRLRLEMGRYLLAEDYVRAMRLRQQLTASVDAALAGCDALLLPALAIPAPLLGASTVTIDGAEEPVRAIMLRLTQLFNLTGHPAIALPAGRDAAGLPMGVQVVGRRGGTAELLAIAANVEPVARTGHA